MSLIDNGAQDDIVNVQRVQATLRDESRVIENETIDKMYMVFQEHSTTKQTELYML